jgi:molecular chaperone Hsp33
VAPQGAPADNFHTSLSSMSTPTRHPSNDPGNAIVSPDRDALSRFLLETSGVRGVIVRLTDTWQAVRARSPYPAAVAERLGETLAAAALFTGHAKVDGRLSVQLRGTGALRSLFAECTHAGTLRGLAQFHEPLPQLLGPRAFGTGSQLAISIENPPREGRDAVRYQGLVGLNADSLPEAFEGYFNQSEQLPTRILLAADEHVAAGIMLQRLPLAERAEEKDSDGWLRATALFDTLRRDELLALPIGQLLFRLFHDDAVRVLDSRLLQFACSCSTERVTSMLQSLGREEAMAATAGGQAEITCEFCGQTYLFSKADITALFSNATHVPAPERLQ